APPDTASKRIINTAACGRARTMATPTRLTSRRQLTHSALSARSRGAGACGPSTPAGGKEQRASGANSFIRDDLKRSAGSFSMLHLRGVFGANLRNSRFQFCRFIVPLHFAQQVGIVSQPSAQSRILRAERVIKDRQRSFKHRLSFVILFLSLPDIGESPEIFSDHGMFLPSHFFIDGQRSFIEWLSLVILPLTPANFRQVVEGAGEPGIFFGPGFFLDADRARDERLSFGIFPLFPVE